MLELETGRLELEALLLDAAELLTIVLDAGVLELETGRLELEALLLDANVLELEDAVVAALEEDSLVLDTTVLRLDGVLDPTVFELEADALELTGLLELEDELDAAALLEAELELAFVDDTELLEATVDEKLEEDEELVPCLIAKALSGTLEVAVTVFVEFFKLQ